MYRIDDTSNNIYPMIEALLKNTEGSMKKSYREIEDEVAQLYNELNEKLDALYKPKVAESVDIVAKRDEILGQSIEDNLLIQFDKLLSNCRTYKYDPDAMEQSLSVRCGPIEWDSYNPYGDYDSCMVMYYRMTASIIVSFPSVAISSYEIAGPVAPTDKFIQDNYIDGSCLNDAEPEEVIRNPRQVIFKFKYVVNDTEVTPDSYFCTLPAFPTRPSN